MAQLWGGRFTKETDQLVYKFNASISFDQRFYEQDIKGSMAHVTMLAKQGILTEEEKKQVDAFVEQIQLEDSTSILQYGAGTQKKMSDFSEGTLEKVRSKDLGEIGDLLNGVVVELKGFDEEEEKGIVGFFKKKASKAQTLKLRYSKAEGSIDQICEKLEGHQVQLLKDSAMLDQLYDLNKVYFRELTMYILAGKKKLEKETNEERKNWHRCVRMNSRRQ